jgi:DNA-binding MarR family transcriptional regulator|tara:strand:- start:14558 stop:15091 length:534 start_codon:yes stop_codon:yes gene_type:complete
MIMVEPIDQVLMSLRQLIRATELHSKKLLKTTGLTTPQLLILRAIHDQAEITTGELASAVSLSQATITNIVDRMEKHGLVSRQRSVIDRRRVYVHLTDHAKTVLTNSPMPLQEHFTERFNQLKDWEQNQVIASLQRVVQMMDASDIVAAPLLTPGIIYDPIDSMGAMPDANKTINSP